MIGAGRNTIGILLLLAITFAVGTWTLYEYMIPVQVASPMPTLVLQPREELEEFEGKQIRIVRDAPYAYQPGIRPIELALDVYLPTEGSNWPLMVYLHGGGWYGGDKSGIGQKGKLFAANGIAVASVNYRLGPMQGETNACNDVADALAILRHVRPLLGFNPNHIVLIGHSAGAHVAALTVCDPKYLGKYPGLADSIKGVIALDGSAYHVPRMMRTYRGLYFFEVFGSDLVNWTRMSPFHHALKNKSLPPFLLVYGYNDAIRMQAARDMAYAIRKSGASATVHSEPLKDHTTIDSDLDRSSDPLTWRVADFVRNPR